MYERAFFAELLDTQNTHWKVAQKGFMELNLTNGQPKIFYILRLKEGCVQKELAKLCDIKESTLTVLLKKMQEQGYIYKQTLSVSGGKRAFGIYLTETGKIKAEAIFDLTQRIDAQSLKDFREDEIELLYSMFDRIRANLSEELNSER